MSVSVSSMLLSIDFISLEVDKDTVTVAPIVEVSRENVSTEVSAENTAGEHDSVYEKGEVFLEVDKDTVEVASIVEFSREDVSVEAYAENAAGEHESVMPVKE